MKFEYSQKLKDYMEQKDTRDLLVYLQPPMGWCGTWQQAVRLINRAAADEYSEQGMPTFKGEMGNVLIDEDCLPYNDDATFSFDLTKFLGMGTVTLSVA